MQDLNKMDNPQFELLNFITQAEEGLFTEQISETMSCLLSDGSIVDLIPNGRYTQVEYSMKE